MRAILCVAALLPGTVRVVSQAGPEAQLAFDVASVKPSIPGEQQLGLRLHASSGLVDVIVIDCAERP